MPHIPEEFTNLLPKAEADEKPLYYLWVYNPHADKVIIEHNKDRHKADFLTHEDMAARVPHPEREHGYAYHIKNGYRITDWDHKPVKDPHIKELVRLALKGEEPPSKPHGSQIQSRAM